MVPAALFPHSSCCCQSPAFPNPVRRSRAPPPTQAAHQRPLTASSKRVLLPSPNAWDPTAPSADGCLHPRSGVPHGCRTHPHLASAPEPVSEAPLVHKLGSGHMLQHTHNFCPPGRWLDSCLPNKSRQPASKPPPSHLAWKGIHIFLSQQTFLPGHVWQD